MEYTTVVKFETYNEAIAFARGIEWADNSLVEVSDTQKRGDSWYVYLLDESDYESARELPEPEIRA